MKRTAKIHIITPYLNNTLVSEICNPLELIKQKAFGLDMYANTELEQAEFPKADVQFLEPWNYTGNEGADLVIAGSTEERESKVMHWKDSGMVIARYSIFYGQNSGYTGNSPEQTGYALDIPKSTRAVATLLLNGKFLDAVVERSYEKIQESTEIVNDKLAKKHLSPILITSHLEKALEVETYE